MQKNVSYNLIVVHPFAQNGWMDQFGIVMSYDPAKIISTELMDSAVIQFDVDEIITVSKTERDEKVFISFIWREIFNENNDCMKRLL